MYLSGYDGVVDPNRGAEYLLKQILVPTVRGMYHDLSSAIRGADLLVTLLLVPVIYAIFVLDLKLVKWEKPEETPEPVPVTA